MLVANVSCFILLMRHRTDDLNMRSTWVCSRNDVIANGGVLLAAAGVAITRTVWPDILIGLLIAGLFLCSAWGVIRASLTALRTGFPTTIRLRRPGRPNLACLSPTRHECHVSSTPSTLSLLYYEGLLC